MRDLFHFNRMRLAAERKAGVASTFMVMTWMSLYTLGQIIALVAGAYFFGLGALSIGTVYLLMAYTDSIFRPLEQITREIQNLQQAAASIDRVQELLAIQPKIVDGTHGTLPNGSLGVRFDEVTFWYDRTDAPVLKPTGDPDSQPKTVQPKLPVVSEDTGPPKIILDGLSFTIEPGEVLGLLGRTGSGKTTITRLLFRLYDPQQGQIVLYNTQGEQAVDAVSLENLRSHVGIVTQDVQLFKASVRDNLTFFDRTIADAQIIAAIEALEMGDWLRRLPNGLDTELASGGTGLSAGEAQLLAFARVFLRNPGLVILDEASSRLDPATEQAIERAVDHLLENRTGIIIAHRLATVHRADKILILEDGQIREYGRYQDLIENPDSRFSELLRAGLEEVLV
jgi:ATP-binding cassette, subfamily B, bacterial